MRDKGRLTRRSSQQTWPPVSVHSGLSKYSSPIIVITFQYVSKSPAIPVSVQICMHLKGRHGVWGKLKEKIQYIICNAGIHCWL